MKADPIVSFHDTDCFNDRAIFFNELWEFL